MAANGKQKLKLLYLLKMLEEETDSEHGLSMPAILERLAEEGIDAERKGIYRDIKVLRDFGYEIVTIPCKPVEYALIRPGMGLPELTLLIDAVQSSKFLTQRTSSHLVKSVRELASVRERSQLDKRVHVDGRIKSQNDSVFHNVDTIHNAMQQKRKLRFYYYKYDNSMKRQMQHNEEPYIHTPVKVVFTNELYYLITWSDKHEDFVSFRIDRMRAVCLTDEKSTSNAQIANFDYEDFAYQSFGMFDGEQMRATLRVAPGAMDIIADRFGTDVPIKQLKDGSADVNVTIRKSAQFFGWVAGLDGAVSLAGPRKLVQEYRAWLKDLSERA